MQWRWKGIVSGAMRGRAEKLCIDGRCYDWIHISIKMILVTNFANLPIVSLPSNTYIKV
jgi:hypothetical protein